MLQDNGKPQAEGGPESDLENEASALAVLEGNVEIDVYKTIGWDFEYGWANS